MHGATAIAGTRAPVQLHVLGHGEALGELGKQVRQAILERRPHVADAHLGCHGRGEDREGGQ